MGLHEIKKLLWNEINGHQIEGADYRMGETLWQLYIWEGINNQNIQGVQKTELPQNQWPNVDMGNWTEQSLSKEKCSNDQKNTEEMLHILVKKGNTTQNHIKILPHSR
jgi:hypothetical protein